MDDDSALYRRVIDELVRDTLEGQGQIGARRIRQGVWNRNATREILPDQLAINELLARLSDADRVLLASIVADAFRSGVHQTLACLHWMEVPPFDKGYEGTPFHDYVGRLDGWEWPDHERS